MSYTICNFGNSYLVSALRDMGHRVVTCGPVDAEYTIDMAHTVQALFRRLQDRGIVPDVFLYVDANMPPYILDIESVPCLSAFISIRSEERRVGKECVSTCRTRLGAVV